MFRIEIEYSLGPRWCWNSNEEKYTETCRQVASTIQAEFKDTCQGTWINKIENRVDKADAVYGCLEVYILLLQSEDPKKRILISSKLRTQRWPNITLMNKRIEQLTDESYSNEERKALMNAWLKDVTRPSENSPQRKLSRYVRQTAERAINKRAFVAGSTRQTRQYFEEYFDQYYCPPRRPHHLAYRLFTSREKSSSSQQREPNNIIHKQKLINDCSNCHQCNSLQAKVKELKNELLRSKNTIVDRDKFIQKNAEGASPYGTKSVTPSTNVPSRPMTCPTGTRPLSQTAPIAPRGNGTKTSPPTPPNELPVAPSKPSGSRPGTAPSVRSKALANKAKDPEMEPIRHTDSNAIEFSQQAISNVEWKAAPKKPSRPQSASNKRPGPAPTPQRPNSACPPGKPKKETSKEKDKSLPEVAPPPAMSSVAPPAGTCKPKSVEEKSAEPSKEESNSWIVPEVTKEEPSKSKESSVKEKEKEKSDKIATRPQAEFFSFLDSDEDEQLKMDDTIQKKSEDDNQELDGEIYEDDDIPIDEIAVVKKKNIVNKVQDASMEEGSIYSNDFEEIQQSSIVDKIAATASTGTGYASTASPDPPKGSFVDLGTTQEMDIVESETESQRDRIQSLMEAPDDDTTSAIQQMQVDAEKKELEEKQRKEKEQEALRAVAEKKEVEDKEKAKKEEEVRLKAEKEKADAEKVEKEKATREESAEEGAARIREEKRQASKERKEKRFQERREQEAKTKELQKQQEELQCLEEEQKRLEEEQRKMMLELELRRIEREQEALEHDTNPSSPASPTTLKQINTQQSKHDEYDEEYLSAFEDENDDDENLAASSIQSLSLEDAAPPKPKTAAAAKQPSVIDRNGSDSLIDGDGDSILDEVPDEDYDEEILSESVE